MKLMAIAAVAGFAGLATASPFFSSTSTSTEITSAPAGALQTITVDISGINSWDLAGATVNETLAVAIGGDFQVVGIGWDVTLQTVGASWLSEAVIGFENAVNLSVGIVDDTPGTMSYSSGGILDLTSIDDGAGGTLDLSFFSGADGNIDIEFFESFDDVAGAIDATFLQGSLQIQYVPAPGALAMLGLGGLVAGRRRR